MNPAQVSGSAIHTCGIEAYWFALVSIADDLSIMWEVIDWIKVGHDQYQTYSMHHTLASYFDLCYHAVL